MKRLCSELRMSVVSVEEWKLSLGEDAIYLMWKDEVSGHTEILRVVIEVILRSDGSDCEECQRLGVIVI